MFDMRICIGGSVGLVFRAHHKKSSPKAAFSEPNARKNLVLPA